MRRWCSTLIIVLFSPAPLMAQDRAWNKLIARIQRDDERLVTRMAAIGILCAKADANGAAQVISILSGWAAEIDQAVESATDIAEQRPLSDRRAMISALVTQGASRLNGIGEPATTLALWTHIATRTWIERPAKEAAFALIVENPSDFSMRRNAALAAIRDSDIGQAGRLPSAFVEFIDSYAVGELRAMVRASDDPTTFNFTAAATLAEAGDTDILADLQSRQRSFALVDGRYGRALAWYTWQIQVQTPPSQLISHIASRELFSPQSRTWAVRKAADRGVPAGETRQAILAYAAAGRPFGPERRAAGIAGIKAIALQLGIFTDADLPNVSTPALPATGNYAKAAGTWKVSTPSVVWQPPWEPRWENFTAFFDWLGTRPCRGLSAADSAELMRQRACELDLLPPSGCQSAASQPTPP